MSTIDQGLLIDIKDLTWGYPENPYLLFNKFNLNLNKNDFLILMGKSGIGKTTIARMLVGELKIPVRSIFHKKQDISQYNDAEMQEYRKKIGIVFQDYKLIDEFTVKKNVTYPLKLHSMSGIAMDKEFSYIKEKLDLQRIANIPVKFLSAGEKQKVCIARALITKPEFVIADEPTGNLDREHTQQIADLLIQTNQMGNTVLLITHDIHLVNYIKEKHNIKLHIMS